VWRLSARLRPALQTLRHVWVGWDCSLLWLGQTRLDWRLLRLHQVGRSRAGRTLLRLHQPRVGRRLLRLRQSRAGRTLRLGQTSVLRLGPTRRLGRTRVGRALLRLGQVRVHNGLGSRRSGLLGNASCGCGNKTLSWLRPGLDLVEHVHGTRGSLEHREVPRDTRALALGERPVIRHEHRRHWRGVHSHLDTGAAVTGDIDQDHDRSHPKGSAHRCDVHSPLHPRSVGPGRDHDHPARRGDGGEVRTGTRTPVCDDDVEEPGSGPQR